MFNNTTISNQLKNSSTVHTQSQVIAEWNLNAFDNIKKIGNYRYRPNIQSPTTANFGTIAPTYDSTDALKAYTGATDSDITVDGGYNPDGIPEVFVSANKKKYMLYSLEECFYKFRPRSGINKMIFFRNKKVNIFSKNMFERPRYYMSSYDDKFKYWTSYRKESSSTQDKFSINTITFNKTSGVFNKTVTFTTSANHTLNVNDSVKVKDSRIHDMTFLPKTYKVLSKTSNTFTVAELQTTWDELSSSMAVTHKEITLSGGVYTANLYLKNTPLFSIGDSVTVSGLSAPYNGSFTLTKINKKTKTVSYTVSTSSTQAKTADPGAVVFNGSKSIAVSGVESNDIVVYRTRYSQEQGFSKKETVNSVTKNYISDAAPFVVYQNSMPINRVVVKMQTNVGKSSPGTFTNSNGTYEDPFYGDSKKTVPNDWKIQYLNSSNQWVDFQGNGSALALNETSVGADGYLELAYGLIIPSQYQETFVYAGKKTSTSSLPTSAPLGYTFLVRSSRELGKFYIWTNNTEELSEDVPLGYSSFNPVYGWQKEADQPTRFTNYVTDLVDVDYYLSGSTKVYTEVQYISGLRVVAKSMNVNGCTFDLIELSPRLTADLTDKTKSIDIDKGAAVVNKKGIPVSGLLASTGTLQLFDYDNAFSEYNPLSILNVKTSAGAIRYNIGSRNLQIKTYDILYDDNGVSYHIPIKALYADGFPEADTGTRLVSIKLRDMFSYFEAMTATEVLYSKASLSFIIASVLDSIGFSNYIFKRVTEKDEPIIPYFYVKPNMTVAEVLQDLSLSTQSAIFFDEYNNLVIMSKEYMFPDSTDRSVDYTFYGSPDAENNGVVRNERNGTQIANILSISSQNEDIYNDGKITYSSRSVQKMLSNPSDPEKKESQQRWVYRNVLLWEAATQDDMRPQNDSDSKSGYTLSAIPLKATLPATLPTVKKFGPITSAVLNKDTRNITYICANTFAVGDVVTISDFSDRKFNVRNKTIKSRTATQFVVASGYTESMSANISATPKAGRDPYSIMFENNIIDFGEAVTMLSRYAGYFYANGEIIRYDAVEFSVSGSGTVWLESATDYKNYFAKLPYGGSIYATGRIRIYAEPKYSGGQIISGAVAKHGRGQFGTTVVSHQAGLTSDWTSATNKRACKMEADYLFGLKTTLPKTAKTGNAGVADSKYYSFNTGIIKNNLGSNASSSTLNDNNVVSGTVQASALVMSGPSFAASEKPTDYISYTHKALDKSFNHFGTRMRIIGEPATSDSGTQNPVGSSSYSVSASKQVKGSSGGIAVMNDPKTNIGYYFELVALTDNSLLTSTSSTIYNVYFYKIERGMVDPNYPNEKPFGTEAYPKTLWAGQTAIYVDDGKFTGQYRVNGEELPTVYDMAVEYRVSSNGDLIFSLFLNNTKIASVVDSSPITDRSNGMSLFVRGKSKVMFENIYALVAKQETNSSEPINTPVSSVFGYDGSKTNDSLFKYGISGMIKSTYLDGITTSGENKYDIYFEEFGTIMREVDYQEIKYDKSYPALYAKLYPNLSSFQEYVTSGFVATPYGAKFLIFNTTDTLLSIGNDTNLSHLRIGGVSFTSQSNNTLTVDEYFSKHADKSDPEVDSDGGLVNLKEYVDYANIKNSRLMYGKKDFNLTANYIQSQDAANEMMGWMINKMISPRKSIGIKIFSNPMLQLGDIVSINYKNTDGQDVIAKTTDRFVIYYIQYNREASGPSMTVYLSEVV